MPDVLVAPIEPDPPSAPVPFGFLPAVNVVSSSLNVLAPEPGIVHVPDQDAFAAPHTDADHGIALLLYVEPEIVTHTWMRTWLEFPAGSCDTSVKSSHTRPAAPLATDH